ncbi:MAG: PKD domain-containing protein [Candidatus Bipolaricaulota bacterium]|nr:PKD domain-containing protein [Candidatus Bipolaricaulota bacterium]
MNLRRTRACASVCIATFFVGLAAGVGCAADVPQVLQPNASAYTADEVALLGGALDVLRVTLSTSTFASQKTFGLGGWGKWASVEFAAYTAGILGGDGYEARLVSAAGWADGVHTWVLVGISLGERVAWVPVEASPEMGAKQTVLGRLPEDTGADGVVWFESAYVGFTDLVEAPANRAPVAEIATKKTSVSTTEYTMLTANGSYDPDGSILLYVWDFGDGEPPTTVGSKYVNHRFAPSGTYVVVLTVVDQRGATAAATVEITASIDCGCSY